MKLKKTVTIEVQGCGCGGFHGRSTWGTFEIPDTGNAQLNYQIAHRRMEAKFGGQYECGAHDSADYHWAFGPVPVGKWTGNELTAENDAVEYTKKRISEIAETLKDSLSQSRWKELNTESAALKEWLRSVAIVPVSPRPRSRRGSALRPRIRRSSRVI
jgi:hypothetical protein